MKQVGCGGKRRSGLNRKDQTTVCEIISITNLQESNPASPFIHERTQNEM